MYLFISAKQSLININVNLKGSFPIVFCSVVNSLNKCVDDAMLECIICNLANVIECSTF